MINSDAYLGLRLAQHPIGGMSIHLMKHLRTLELRCKYKKQTQAGHTLGQTEMLVEIVM